MVPMLAGKCSDIAKLKYPLLASPKLDGVRAIVEGIKPPRLLARSLKPIPNAFAQKVFGCLPRGVDGELIVGDPTAPDAYRKTVSAVMSQDGEPDHLRFHVFDMFDGDPAVSFQSRLENLGHAIHNEFYVSPVPHTMIYSAEELDAYENHMVTLGYEGVMVRSLSGPYKEGRSTEKEGYLLKIKRFADSEAVVTGFYELKHNDNAAEKNALGHTERSTKKEGMVLGGVLGGLEVRDVKTGVEFCIGGGFTAADRAALWADRDSLVGRTTKYKYFASGSKDKPRFPVWLGWRNSIDL